MGQGRMGLVSHPRVPRQEMRLSTPAHCGPVLGFSQGLVRCESTSRALERSGKECRRRWLSSLSGPVWSREGTWRENELLSPKPHPLHSQRCQRNVDLQQEIRKKERQQKQILILRCYFLGYLEMKSAGRCPGKTLTKHLGQIRGTECLRTWRQSAESRGPEPISLPAISSLGGEWRPGAPGGGRREVPLGVTVTSPGLPALPSPPRARPASASANRTGKVCARPRR